jgi:hypothetical protein
MVSIWDFLQNESNRAVLGWIGGGIVIVIGGLWAVFRFFLSKKVKKKGTPAPTVTATHGGIAAGRDIRDNQIDVRG